MAKIDEGRLREFLSIPKMDAVDIFVREFGKPTHEGDAYWLWYEPNKPLLVAHIDTVYPPQPPVDVGEGAWLTYGAADGRAGVYTIYELKKKDPGGLSILLTDHKEVRADHKEIRSIGATNFCSMAKDRNLKFLYAIEYSLQGWDDCIDCNNVNDTYFMSVFKKYYKLASCNDSYSDAYIIQLELCLSAVNLSAGYKYSKQESLCVGTIERNLELFDKIRKALGERPYPTKSGCT